MQLTKYSLLVAIGKIIEKHGENYSYASSKTMLELLSKYAKISIKKRMYFRHMADLRKEGLVKSIRRYGREPNGTIYNRTSAVCITIKGYVALALRGWKWALDMAKKLRGIHVPRKTKTATVIIPANKIEEKKEADTLKQIAKKVRKEGISLYDFLLSDGKNQRQSKNSVNGVAKQPSPGH